MTNYHEADEDLLREFALAVLHDEDPDAIRRLRAEIEKSATFDPHPTQQIRADAQGVRRFRKNELVRRLVDEHHGTLNTIATWCGSREDASQLAQLIGYSVDGYHSLSYAIPVEDEEG
jgi:hypothetical protein